VLVLGIETATQVCGAALTEEGRLLCEYRANLKNRHAAVLTAAIETLFRDAQKTISQLDGIAVSIGPGSFTGLRIGLATAKGILFAAGCRLTTVSTLQALASQAPAGTALICPVVRSRGQELYAAIYRRTADGLELEREPIVIASPILAGELPADACVIGELPADVEQIFKASDITVAPAESRLLSAFTIARIGTERLRCGESEEAELLEPRYHQDFVAGKPRAAIFDPGLHER